MANTYSKIYIQIIFAIQNRDASIQLEWEPELHKYITGIIQGKGQKMLAINGTENHIHMLIGLKPTCCLSDLVRETKKSSTQFVEDNKLSRYKFRWQEGYGAFSYGHSQLDMIIRYIANQKAHHRHNSFKEEYMGFLKLFDIDFKDEYLFHWIDE